jgi:uncharacterized membrane protein (UPF0136 family)
MKLQRDLNALRPFVVPAAIVLGLFLLVSTPRYHLALTPQARAYTLCAFGLLIGGAVSGVAGAVGEAGRRRWSLVRATNAAALLAAFGAWRLEAASPIPPVMLTLLGLALAAACWWPPLMRR